MKILAIDPALSTTGLAVMDDKKTLLHVSKFCTKKEDGTEDERIFNIVSHIHNIVKQFNIEYIVLEDGFVGVNAKTGLQLSKLRGGIIVHFMFEGLKVGYDLPSHIRKSFGCKGNAKKEEIAKKVLLLYPYLENIIGPYSDAQNKKKTSDMYDAISIGIGFLNK